MLSHITKLQLKELLEADQLIREMKRNNCFEGFTEGTIKFKPTYRYERGNRIYSEEVRQY